MRRKTSIWRLGMGLLVAGMLVGGAFSQNPSPAVLRARSEKLMNDGNFREAYDGFRRLCLDPSDGGAGEPGPDQRRAVPESPRPLQEFDELVESTIAAHKENWRLLQTAAQQYLERSASGLIGSPGKYERGPHRGGGEVINSVERDRVRALQLMRAGDAAGRRRTTTRTRSRSSS